MQHLTNAHRGQAIGRRSPRAIGNVMLLSVWCENDIDIDLPPPECLVIDKEVTPPNVPAFPITVPRPSRLFLPCYDLLP